LASMCPAMPYTIAAKFAYPDRPAIGLIGDGAMQMLGINGLITVAKYWKTWSSPTFIMLVLNNHDLNQVTWEQRVMNGDGRFDDAQDIMDFAYADYAKLLGLDGIKVTDPAAVPAAWDAAFASNKPFVLDIHTDPAVPPLPPHIDFKQMKAFSTSLLKGDSDAWNMVKQTYKDMVDEYLPH
ncbi:MAG: thiamine pyrophosphate-requiring protein, partial [Hymenobacter sp.]